MFKKIQNYLLINHPLIWNVKIIPMVAFLICFHIVFFIMGYINGALDFTQERNNYNSGPDDIILFFGVIIMILSLIIWLVYYFKNNAFKSYYPKNNFSIFKEWLMLLLLSLLLVSFTMSYFYAKDVRLRNYYSEAEARERCETLALASIFSAGSFSYSDYKMIDSSGIQIEVPVTHLDYRGKQYSLKSLLNKNIETFSFHDRTKDSILEVRTKDWMVNNQKDSVQFLFNKFFALASEHGLKGNISANQWLDLVYDYPDFTDYKIVGNAKTKYLYDYSYDNVERKVDSVNNYIQTINGKQYVVNKYYVPADALQYSYEKIAESYVSPNVGLPFLLIVMYLAFGLGLLIFSFRVTSGRNWLINLVALGIINMVFGIISIISSSEYLYMGLMVLLFIGLLVHFFIVLARKKGKGFSGITLNAILWLFPGFVPAVYILLFEISKQSTGYYENRLLEYHPSVQFFEDHFIEMAWINLIVMFLFMLFFTMKIKRWKGIAES